ncbi:hypothetical protein DFAR_3460036 [Desulfarculales bacterium]
MIPIPACGWVDAPCTWVWGEMSQLLVECLAGISLTKLAEQQWEKDRQCLVVAAVG